VDNLPGGECYDAGTDELCEDNPDYVFVFSGAPDATCDDLDLFAPSYGGWPSMCALFTTADPSFSTECAASCGLCDDGTTTPTSTTGTTGTTDTPTTDVCEDDASYEASGWTCELLSGYSDYITGPYAYIYADYDYGLCGAVDFTYGASFIEACPSACGVCDDDTSTTDTDTPTTDTPTTDVCEDNPYYNSGPPYVLGCENVSSLYADLIAGTAYDSYDEGFCGFMDASFGFDLVTECPSTCDLCDD
jgi:hypothetical protein